MGRRFFMIGAILLLLGAQLRLVDSYVLTPKASQFVEARLHTSGLANSGLYDPSYLYSVGPYPTSNKTFTPPRWIGWAFLSVGAVLVLHSLTISRFD
jgi:hypothetical protein